MTQQTLYEKLSEVIYNNFGVITNEQLWKTEVIKFSDYERHLTKDQTHSYNFQAVKTSLGMQIAVNQYIRGAAIWKNSFYLSWSRLYREYCKLFPNLFGVEVR